MRVPSMLSLPLEHVMIVGAHLDLLVGARSIVLLLSVQTPAPASSAFAQPTRYATHRVCSQAGGAARIRISPRLLPERPISLQSTETKLATHPSRRRRSDAKLAGSSTVQNSAWPHLPSWPTG